MTTVKNQDFVQIEYTGKLSETNDIFDTTNEEIAKKEGIHNPMMPYGRYVICVGEGQILHGLEEQLIGKKVGEKLSIELSAEKAFGKKDAKLLKLVPTNVFRKEGIQVQPGLQVNIDGTIGTIRTVTGGRTIVDFNHPLSGKNVVYDVKIDKIITDEKEKVTSYIKMALSTKDVEVSGDKGDFSITVPAEYPKEMNDIITDKIKKVIPSVKNVKILNKSNKTIKTSEKSTTLEAQNLNS